MLTEYLSSQAGGLTRATGKGKFHADLKFWIFLFCVSLGIVLVIFDHRVLGLGWVGVLGLVAIAYRMPGKIKDTLLDKEKELTRYFLGVTGEEQVGELLQVSDEFVVMHDVISPEGNTGLIVFDKRGNIFILETRAHYGKVTAEGNQLHWAGLPLRKEIIGKALVNSYWMKEKIEAQLKVSAWVTPVVVFTNASVEYGRPINGVYYTGKEYLAEFLRRTLGSSPAGVKLWEMRGQVLH